MPSGLARFRVLRHWLRNGRLALTIPLRQHTIEISEASTIFGSSFGDDGWHHIRRTLVQYDLDRRIAVEDTVLFQYLRHFTPGSICSLACRTCARHRAAPFAAPWGSFGRDEVWLNKNPETSRFCGPSTDAFIGDEFTRVIALYERLAGIGYRPWARGHGFIEGVLLLAESGERRFVVLQGNHRMAILAHLGVQRLTVRTLAGARSPIRERDVADWPMVERGLCEPESAAAVFRMFFDEDGHHIKDRIAEHSAPLRTSPAPAR